MSSRNEKVPYTGYAPLCEEIIKSTYAIYVSDTEGNPINKYEGTAFAVSEDGLFLTATHVLNEIKNKIDESNRHLALVRDISPFGMNTQVILGANIIKEYDTKSSDISVLKAGIDEVDSYSHLDLRTKGEVESMGQPTAAFGYPNAINDFSDGWNINQATVSGIVSSIHTFEDWPAYQVDTLFHPGLSGGPLISLREGDVIGVVHGREKYEDSDGYSNKLFPAQISQAKVITRTQHGDIGTELEDMGVSYRHEI